MKSISKYSKEAFLIRPVSWGETASVMMLASPQNITIPVNIYKGIRNLLDSYHTPELIKVQSLSDLTEILFLLSSLFASFKWLLKIWLCLSVCDCFGGPQTTGPKWVNGIFCCRHCK